MKRLREILCPGCSLTERYDPEEPRIQKGLPRAGRWAVSPNAIGHGYSPRATLKNGVIFTDNVYDAIRALYEGKKVELQQIDQVCVSVKKLKKLTKRIVGIGGKPRNFNLCNILISGTSLFCAETKGIPRIKMPQLEDDQVQSFLKHLKDEGYTVTGDTVLDSHLRPTQDELVGYAVSKMVRDFEKKPWDRTLIVSKDNYILDGHHYWATNLVADAEDDDFTNKIKVDRVNIGILDLVMEANAFTGGKGHMGIDMSKVLKAIG